MFAERDGNERLLFHFEWSRNFHIKWPFLFLVPEFAELACFFQNVFKIAAIRLIPLR